MKETLYFIFNVLDSLELQSHKSALAHVCINFPVFLSASHLNINTDVVNKAEQTSQTLSHSGVSHM